MTKTSAMDNFKEALTH